MLPLAFTADILFSSSSSSCENDDDDDVKYRFIEFFVFDCDSLLIDFVFWSGVTFPLVALDRIYCCGCYFLLYCFNSYTQIHADVCIPSMIYGIL